MPFSLVFTYPHRPIPPSAPRCLAEGLGTEGLGGRWIIPTLSLRTGEAAIARHFSPVGVIAGDAVALYYGDCMDFTLQMLGNDTEVHAPMTSLRLRCHANVALHYEAICSGARQEVRSLGGVFGS